MSFIWSRVRSSFDRRLYVKSLYKDENGFFRSPENMLSRLLCREDNGLDPSTKFFPERARPFVDSLTWDSLFIASEATTIVPLLSSSGLQLWASFVVTGVPPVSSRCFPVLVDSDEKRENFFVELLVIGLWIVPPPLTTSRLTILRPKPRFLVGVADREERLRWDARCKISSFNLVTTVFTLTVLVTTDCESSLATESFWIIGDFDKEAWDSRSSRYSVFETDGLTTLSKKVWSRAVPWTGLLSIWSKSKNNGVRVRPELRTCEFSFGDFTGWPAIGLISFIIFIYTWGTSPSMTSDFDSLKTSS